jgi:hypothetical protein
MVTTTKENPVKTIVPMITVLVLLCSLLPGCGSSSTSANRQQKTAVVIFSTVSSAHNAPLQGIQLTTKLPSGATVADITTALSGVNDTGLLGTRSYIPVPPTVSFIVQQSGTAPIKFGPFARLTCDVTPGSTLTESSFSVARSDLQLTGKDPGGTTIDLVDQIPVKLGMTFGY